MVIIVMGPTGAGKSTIGRALAAAQRWPLVEGDDYHSASNLDKIKRGTPLTDEDRAPWLAVLHGVIARAVERRDSLVLTCSALKARYRQTLGGELRRVRFVYLRAPERVLRERLERRAGHIAGPTLLASQLATLEEPESPMS